MKFANAMGKLKANRQFTTDLSFILDGSRKISTVLTSDHITKFHLFSLLRFDLCSTHGNSSLGK